MSRMTSVLFLLVASLALSACIIEEPPVGPGRERWCVEHPYRCR